MTFFDKTLMYITKNEYLFMLTLMIVTYSVISFVCIQVVHHTNTAMVWRTKYA